jgi:hypothetical protein
LRSARRSVRSRLGRDVIAPTVAHPAALELMRETPVPLAEELALLAWLAAQTRQAIQLGPWLDERQTWLAGQ